MEYIDIDSSYRNRNENPKQAQFKVLREQQHVCTSNQCDVFIRDAVSLESILFPNPQENPPLAFYEETLQEPKETIVSRQNLPFMYSTNTPNVIQLDELVLASTDPTTTSVTENALYPRGSIPLGQANEFYTGDILEDVLNKEFRKITSFRYDDNPNNVFQTGVVQSAVTFSSGDAFITVDPTSVTQLPFSNIDRFYQGKFLTMLSGNASGLSKLITNYTTTSPTQYTFQLESSFGVTINIGDNFAVVSDRKWFATIESPFTNNPSSYPCFRNLLPNQVSWSPNVLSTDFSDVEYLRVYQQAVGLLGAQNMAIDILVDNGSTSLAGDSLGNISHLISNDTNGQYGFTNVFTRSDVILKTHFGSAYLLSDDYSYYGSIDTYVPYIVYAEASTTVANNWSIRLLSGYDKNGQTWDDSEVIASYTSGSVIAQNISAVSSADNSTLLCTWAVYDGATYDLVFYNTSSTVLVAANNVNLMAVIDLRIIDGNPAIIYYEDDGSNTLKYIRATDAVGSAWGSIESYGSSIYLDYNLTQVDIGSGITRPYSIYGDTLSNESLLVYGSTTTGTLSTDTLDLLIFKSARILQTNVGENDFPIVLAVDNIDSRLWMMFSNVANPGLGTGDAENDFNGLKLIDSNVVSVIDMVSNYDDEPLIVYIRTFGTTTELVSLNLSDFISQECSVYRIRRGTPQFFGNPSSGILTASTANTITLPSTFMETDDFFKCMYLHLTNFDFYQVQSQLNEFLFITDYNSTTNVITFTPPLATAPSSIIAPTYDDFSGVALNFTNSADIGEDFSPNNFDFTILAGASYASSYTDSNGLTLTDTMFITSGGAPRGLERTFVTTAEAINVIAQGQRITIALWFLTVGGTTSQTIFNLADTATTPKGIEIELDSSGDLHITTTGGTSEIEFTYSGITANVWYHLVYVHTEFGIDAYINKVNVNSLLTFQKGNLQTPYPTIGSFFVDFIRVGRFTNFNGYMKNVLYTGQPFDATQVQTNYDATFNTANYINWEILGQVVDQFNPLDYFGTPTPSQMVCYEMELTHLTLPNVILKTGIGNRIAFYPYVYVEFANSNHSSEKHFYSNNPNTTRVLFKVPIRDTSTPERATFVNNTSGMRILSKFNPNDNFNFTVYLPNGELFETSQSDTSSPLPPDPLLQLSATFGFKRANL